VKEGEQKIGIRSKDDEGNERKKVNREGKLAIVLEGLGGVLWPRFSGNIFC